VSSKLIHAAPERIPAEHRAGRTAGTKWRRRAIASAYLGPALALYGLFVLWPLVRVGILSLQRWDGYSPPIFVGFDNFAALSADPGFQAELQHSLVWVLVTLSVPVGTGMVLALLLRSVLPRLRAPLRGLLLLPLLLPTVLTSVIWRLFYNPLSGPITSFLHAVGAGWLAGDWLGDPRLALPALLVVACWGSFGLSMLICEAGLAKIGNDVPAAARLDGAGGLVLFWVTTMPVLRGVLPLAVVATGFCAIPSYDLVSLLTNGGPGYATTTLALDSFGRAFGGNGEIGIGASLAAIQACAGFVLAVAALLVSRSLSSGEVGLDETHAQKRKPGQSAAASSILLVAGLSILAPLAWLIVLVMRPANGDGGWTALTSNLSGVWDQGFGGAMATSLWTSLMVSASTVTLALGAGFALSTSRSRLFKACAAVVLALGIFQPMSVLIIPLFDVIQSLGLLNSEIGVMGPQIARALAVSTLLIWAGIRDLPRAVLDAAAVDGASHWSLIQRIIIPLTYPLLLVAAVWSFLLSWNDYLLPDVVLAGSQTQTVPLALAHFTGRVDTEYGLLAAGALTALLPITLAYALFYRVLARGFRQLAR
jgi:raffinose/stachyose/melibiose transport system permease protein